MPSFPAPDTTRLWYDIRGDGPPLLCLAGGPGADVRSLGDLGGLDRHRTLITLDSRAAGRSDVPADRQSCTFVAQARDVEALRQHLGLATVDVLAHSAGALTAGEFAARFHTAGRLVLVTPAGRAAREPDDAEAAAIRARNVTTREPDESDLVVPPSWLREVFYSPGRDPAGTAQRLARLSRLDTPVLAVAGEVDGIAGVGTARLVGGWCPRARVEIMPGCGHFPWLDDPTGFRTRVVAFLDEAA